MNLFARLFGKRRVPLSPAIAAQAAFDVNLVLSEVMFEGDERTESGLFEVMLFISLLTYRHFEQQLPTTHFEFEEHYSNLLGNYADEKGITKKLRPSLEIFINRRLHMHSDELILFEEASKSGKVYFSPKLFHHLQNTPLKQGDDFSKIYDKKLLLEGRLTAIIQVLRTKLSRII